jgi:hypothetical protein
MRLNKTEKHLLLLIRKIQGKNDFCRLTKPWLAEQMGVSTRTIQRTKASLRNKRLIFEKKIEGKTSLMSTVPICQRSARIVKIKLEQIQKLKRNQFTFCANGETIFLEDKKTEADKISFVAHAEKNHPLEKNVSTKNEKLSPPYRQSIKDNLNSNPKGLEEATKVDSDQLLFEKPKKAKKPKQKNESEIVQIERYLFNFWNYIGKQYYYSYPKERKQLKRLLEIATVNEICNRFAQLYELMLSDERYKDRSLLPTGLSFHVLNVLQSRNKDSREQIRSTPFYPKTRKENKKIYGFYLEFSAWKKGFKSYVHQLRARQTAERKKYGNGEIRF